MEGGRRSAGRLAVFDFDHTIVDDNSDTAVRRLLPADSVPKRVEALHRSEGWTGYMQEIFNLLHRFKVSREEIASTVASLRETPNMLALLRWLRDAGWEIVVLSDANSYFIGEWLRRHRLETAVARVFTNPAAFVGGRLKIEKYHTQDWCRLSTENLCKGHVLDGFIEERRREGTVFSTVAYVGDGKNDYCPSLRLAEKDLLFPRLGYRLSEILAAPSSDGVVKAGVHPWSDAKHILQVLSDLPVASSPPPPHL